MKVEVKIPSLGESVSEATISQWLKQEGDSVKQYEPVLEVETDKVTTEVVAESAGVILKIMVAAGETVPVGNVLAFIGAAGERLTGVRADGW